MFCDVSVGSTAAASTCVSICLLKHQHGGWRAACFLAGNSSTWRQQYGCAFCGPDEARGRTAGLGDLANARALFERALTDAPPEAASKLWDAFLQFEYEVGTLAAIQVRGKEGVAGRVWEGSQGGAKDLTCGKAERAACQLAGCLRGACGMMG